jgi:hypothetical protein
MGLLVQQKLFPITIKYVEIPLKSGRSGILIVKTDEQEKKYKDKIKELETQWLQPNFKETNDLIREATVYEHFKGERDIDHYLYRALVLDRFLKAWNITDDAGQPIPCNPANMALLDVSIALELIDKFNTQNLPTEADLKN